MGSMRKTSIEYCKSCEYHFGGDNDIVICGYLLKTGKRRNCQIGECDKYEKQSKERKAEIPWSEVSTVLSQMN